jgi:dTDP-4-dehydrorhamnose 3,5-epimerase
MRFTETGIEGAVLVHPDPHADDRGHFARVFCVDEFEAQGLETHVEQTNVAVTNAPGTVRGLHYQLPPSGEAKLIRCTRGAIYDVAVDLRSGSPTFGQHVGAELSAADGTAMYIPAGCAHGYQALHADTAVLYQVSAPYAAELERGVDHADPQIGIRWPLPPANVSAKDRALPALADAELPVIDGG